MKLLALIMLIPMIVGPLPEEPNVLTATLCGGGVITIPIGNNDQEPKRDCHQKACHAGSCRQKAKKPI